MSEEKKESTTDKKITLADNSVIHCFACGARTDLSGCSPGEKINCKECSVEITVPDEDVIKKLASLESFTQIPKTEPKAEKPHKIFCQGCGAKIDVTGQAVDTKFSCPACGMVLKVPEKPSDDLEETKDASEEEVSKKSKEKSDKKEAEKKETGSTEKLKINCHTCGAKIDVTGEEPFKKVNCPACNASFQIPKRYSHFLLEQRLGETKNFSVYRALDLTLSREVCLKVMKPELCKNKKMVESFLSEAGKTALVNDPNVVPIYSSGEYEDCSYLVMQFMSALSLKPYLEKAKGILPISSVLRVVKEAAKGLQAAHSQGILHNNISLNNILLDREGNVKVSDFSFDYSLYEFSDNKDKLLDFFDPQYISMEMVKDGKNCLAGDIYSLGAVFYHLITGVPPFPGNDPESIIKERLERSPVAAIKVRSEIPEYISEYIGKMMSENKDDRPASFKDVISSLETFMDGSQAKNTAAATPVAVGSSDSTSPNTNETVSSSSDDDPIELLKKVPAIVYAIVAALIVVLVVILKMPKEEPEVKPVFGQQMDKNLIKAQKAEEALNKAKETVAEPAQVDAAEQASIEDGGNKPEDVTSTQAAAMPQLEGQGFPVKVNERPSPDGLAFTAISDEVFAYLEKHEGQAYDQEMMRLKTLRDIRSYLEKIISGVPYQGKIYVKGRNAIDGSIISGDSAELTIKPLASDQTLSLSWEQFEILQYVSMLEYYIQLRSEQLSNSSDAAIVKRDLGADYFRLALLCDWYSLSEQSQKYATLSLQNDSQLIKQVTALLPSISE